MSQPALILQDVSFAYETSTQPLLEAVQLGLGPGWSGVIGANGTGKTTLLRLATGELRPTSGEVVGPARALYCPQRTDEVPAFLPEFLADADPLACRARGRLGLQQDWVGRWATLSHGERKRAQIAVALWREPDVLAIDEPTNHLDREARRLLAEALEAYRGIGLLVSHDRELLDQLCRQCLFVEPPGVVRRSGGYSTAMAEIERERLAARRKLQSAARARKRIEREVAKRRDEARRADRKRSKRGISRKDHDAKSKIDGARVTGKDAVAGKLMRQLEGRLEQARAKQAAIGVRKRHELGIWLPGSTADTKALLHLPEGELRLGEERRLRYPDLVLMPRDRVALVGPNGSGKSTLVRRVVRALKLPEERLTYIPQEIDLRATKEILRAARALPSDQLGHAMMVVSRLNSRPERLLDSDEPSPGEIRKLLLAMKIAQQPHLIVMDEPTNHMDLPSIECLERALEDCPCAMVLVSHDERFLGKLTRKRWEIGASDAHPGAYRLREL